MENDFKTNPEEFFNELAEVILTCFELEEFIFLYNECNELQEV